MSEEFPLLGTPTHATGLSAVSPSGCFRVLICPLQPVNLVCRRFRVLLFVAYYLGRTVAAPPLAFPGREVFSFGTEFIVQVLQADVVVVEVFVGSWFFEGFSFGCWLYVLFWLWWLIGLVFAISLL